MKRRFANAVEGDYQQKRIDEDYFNGYVCYVQINGVQKPLIVNNGITEVCIKDNGYKWLEIYPDKANYAITVMFDDKSNLIEWYFDIAKQIGIEKGVPYEDDLYLDMVILPDGKKSILDEDELLNALQSGHIQQSDVDLAYNTLHILETKYANLDYLVSLTNKLCKEFQNLTNVKDA